ncbi:hypothetical protein [Nostoc sp.]
MLDLAKIQSIAQSYSPQELFAALVWQRRCRFNEFDGEQVITDLSNHRNLWASFLFTKSDLCNYYFVNIEIRFYI